MKNKCCSAVSLLVHIYFLTFCNNAKLLRQPRIGDQNNVKSLNQQRTICHMAPLTWSCFSMSCFPLFLCMFAQWRYVGVVISVPPTVHSLSPPSSFFFKIQIWCIMPYCSFSLLSGANDSPKNTAHEFKCMFSLILSGPRRFLVYGSKDRAFEKALSEEAAVAGMAK